MTLRELRDRLRVRVPWPDGDNAPLTYGEAKEILARWEIAERCAECLDTFKGPRLTNQEAYALTAWRRLRLR